jgi:hypothetical protein
MRIYVVFFSQLLCIAATVLLQGQSLPLQDDPQVLRVLKERHAQLILFIDRHDTICFDSKTIKKSEQPLVRITTSNGDSYSVITFFSGIGYFINTGPNDSLLITFGDMPYGELIVNNLSKEDKASNLLNVDRLNCIVSVNGLKGQPNLDMDGKTIDTEKTKKAPIKDLLITDNGGNKVFCRAKVEVSNTIHPVTYLLQFNEDNSNELSRHLKIAMLFIFWLYEDSNKK